MDASDQQYNYDELWYANFRVRKRTFEFILDKIHREISHKSNPCLTQLQENDLWLKRCAIYSLSRASNSCKICLACLDRLCVSAYEK